MMGLRPSQACTSFLQQDTSYLCHEMSVMRRLQHTSGHGSRHLGFLMDAAELAKLAADGPGSQELEMQRSMQTAP